VDVYGMEERWVGGIIILKQHNGNRPIDNAKTAQFTPHISIL